MKSYWKWIAVVTLITFVVGFRIWGLHDLPGEWFGDISNVHEYVLQIKQGLWPWYFFQSAGPVYHYVITPMLFFLPLHGYDAYKASSVIVSLLGLIITGLFVYECTKRQNIALFTIFVMGVGYWFLIWSRLGNSQIIIPLLISFVSLCIVQFQQSRRASDALRAAGIASIGWFVYPHTYILPIAILFYLTGYVVVTKNIRHKPFLLLSMWAIIALGTFLFIQLVVHDKTGNFGPSGYLGAKVLPIFTSQPLTVLSLVIRNLLRVLGMLHIKGDPISRSNIPYHPQLDVVSGVSFILGIVFFIYKKWWKQLVYIVFMMAFLIVPSISPAIPEGEIPNSGRTIAITPFVYLFVAAGLAGIYDLVKKVTKYTPVAVSILMILFVSIAVINFRLYFVSYAYSLPEHNLHPGTYIVSAMETYFPRVPMYFADCCWAEAGEPEPKGIIYNLSWVQKDDTFEAFTTSCTALRSLPAVIMLSPKYAPDEEKLYACGKSHRIMTVTRKNEPVARLLYVE